jgi:hypothetical protein
MIMKSGEKLFGMMPFWQKVVECAVRQFGVLFFNEEFVDTA